MSNEYYAAIVEFRSREIKIGFVGESSEHTRVSSSSPLWKKLVPKTKPTLPLPAYLHLDSHSLTPELKSELLQNSFDSHHRDVLAAYERDSKDRKWFDWSSDNYVTLSTMVKVLLSTSLLVSPLRTKLFVLGDSLSVVEKTALCKSFLDMKTAVSVTFLPFSPCSCMASGLEDALVIFLDWSCCRITPVIDLRSLPGWDFVRFTGESLHYAAKLPHAVQNFEKIELEVISDKSIIDSVLFGTDGLPRKIADLVETLEVDQRASVVDNIIITGSIADIPGIKGRLLTEIANHLPKSRISGKVCLGAWTGASLYCSTTLLKEKSSIWKHMEISRKNIERISQALLENYD